MARYKITQTLLSSWNYLYNCWEGQEEEAMASFLSTLRREKQEPTDAMLDGIDFEKRCYMWASGMNIPSSEWDSGICAIVDVIRGGQFQVPASREIIVDGMDFLVYGILDVLKAGKIYDIKKKAKGFGSLDLAGSYLNSPQHPFYFYIVPEATEFTYLVSDGVDLYTERYTPDMCPAAGDLIYDFIQFLKSENLLELYKEKWVLE